MSQRGDQLAAAIWGYATDQTDRFTGGGSDEYKKHGGELAVLGCTIAFLVLAIDRQLWTNFGETKRDDIMDELMSRLNGIASDQLGKNNKAKLDEQFAKYMSELAPYSHQLLPEEGEGAGGTLAWEYCKFLDARFGFGKKVALVAYASAPDAVRFILEEAGLTHQNNLMEKGLTGWQMLVIALVSVPLANASRAIGAAVESPVGTVLFIVFSALFILLLPLSIARFITDAVKKRKS